MIKFKNIEWANFLSTGNSPIKINLSKDPITLISGPNGAGKSTMLDAIYFALYGKSYRKINIPGLINSINQKNMWVKLEFSIQSIDYKVIRGKKPNIFEIWKADKMIEQDSKVKDYQLILEQDILKLNEKTFKQIVILGSAKYVSFMALKLQDRREIVEDLLDLKVFSTMLSMAKDELHKINDNKIDVDNKITQANLEIKLCRSHLERMEKHTGETDRKKQVEEKKQELEEKNSIEKKLLLKIDEKEKEYDTWTEKNIDTKMSEMQKMKMLMSTKTSSLKKEITYYQDNDVCSVCHQDINEQFKSEMIESNKKSLDKLKDGEKKHDDIWALLEQDKKRMDVVLEELVELKKRIEKNQMEISIIQKFIDDSKSTPSDEVAMSEKDIKLAEEKLKTLEKSQKKITDEITIYGMVIRMLQDDGIKSKIIKQYLPIINHAMNKYLAMFDFYIGFEFDDNFQELVKSRHRDDFSYYNFSEGQKVRIDLAILFAWRHVVKLKNKASTNLLIFDEIFDSSLDSEGTESFIKVVQEMSGDNHNIFLISHKHDQNVDKFDHVIQFKHEQNFTSMQV